MVDDAMVSADTTPTVAFGVHISLTTSEQGGRASPLHIDFGAASRFQYRPDWALPGTQLPELSGAYVVGWSRTGVLLPGQAAHAVIVPPFPLSSSRWAQLEPDLELAMHEGPRVVGWGRLLWRSPIAWLLPPVDAERFTRWLAVADGVDRAD